MPDPLRANDRNPSVISIDAAFEDVNRCIYL